MQRIPSIILAIFTCVFAIHVNRSSETEWVDPPAVSVSSEEKQRGVGWVAGNEITLNHMIPLAENKIEWIEQTPFGWQRRYDSPKIALITSGRVLWGETDEGLRITTEYAKKFGIKTLLKPHIWLREKPGGKWRANIDFETEEGWTEWFDNYRTFIIHYATFAQTHDIEILCIGTELHNPAVERAADWRKLIAEIREVYQGKLTYAANWYQEYEEITFWDKLDFIGIQGYFPLTDKSHPSVEDLKRGWKPHLKKIERLSKRYGKPVLFTEQGYKSTHDAAIRPWEWPQEADKKKIDLQTQANCYEAFFQTFWDKPWCAGVYWWKWYPTSKVITNRSAANALYTPQGKPSQDVIKKWYGKPAEDRK